MSHRNASGRRTLVAALMVFAVCFSTMPGCLLVAAGAAGAGAGYVVANEKTRDSSSDKSDSK